MAAHRKASFFGVILMAGVLFVSGVILVKNIIDAVASNLTSRVMISNSIPIVSAVVLNNGDAITLTGNATTVVRVAFTTTDQNGCNDIYANGSIQTILFRSGAIGGSSCATSTLNCYRVSTTTENTCTANATTTTATSTFEVYYLADATDSSSSYPAEDWVAYVLATDGSNATGSATSTHREINTLTAINLSTTSINYGAVSANTDTGATNQTVTTQNAGNSSTSLKLNAQQTLTSDANTITTSSQHYATSSFTYGGNEQSLQDAATAISGFLIPRPPLTSWATTTPLPSAIRSLSSAAHNGYLYTTGGFTSSNGATSTVFYAPISSSTGSIGAWATTTPLPSAVRSHLAVVYNGFLYTIGGASSTVTSTVFYAPINSTGSIGAWATTSPLPGAIYTHSGAVYNGFLYAAGGFDADSIVTSTVSYAQINSNGTVGTWATTTPLPTAIFQHSIAAYNGYLYMTGGSSSGTSTILYAQINSNGTLGAWTLTSPSPSTIKNHFTVAYNGLLYVTGGRDVGLNNTSTIFFASIHSNGTVSTWANTASLPTGIQQHSGATFNGYLYTTGGVDVSSVVTSTVFYTPIAARDTFWGLSVPGGTPTGTYTGTNVFSEVFQP